MDGATAPPFNKRGENMSFVREVSTRGRSKLTDEQRIAAQDLLEKAKDEDSRMVTGVFNNLECQGGDVEFAYHKYKGEPTRVYHMEDGKEYTIPYGVAKHINEQCKYSRKQHNPVLQKTSSGDWKPVEGKPIVRYKFVSTDF